MHTHYRKPLTLVLAIALGVILGRGSVTTAAAGQGNMQGALSALEQARGELQSAATDKAGHRVKAMEATEHAIEETRAGIAAGAR
jgi:hypothetical protein